VLPRFRLLNKTTDNPDFFQPLNGPLRGEEIKNDETKGTCSTQGESEKFTQKFNREILREHHPFTVRYFRPDFPNGNNFETLREFVK
jgi:hypothetical protein